MPVWLVQHLPTDPFDLFPIGHPDNRRFNAGRTTDCNSFGV